MAIVMEPVVSMRACSQVAAAIELVAQGRYPRVSVSGIRDACRIAAAFEEDAARRGVELILEPPRDGVSLGIVVRRR